MDIVSLLKRSIKFPIHLLAARLGRHRRKADQPQLLILMYHRVLPASHPEAAYEEPGMMVTPQTLRQNLLELQNHFTMVRLSDWIEDRKNNRPLPDKACAITFDDGWADNYTYAFPVLTELTVPATIFLVSDMINTSREFWPERLSRLLVTIASEHPAAWQSDALQWLPRTGTSYRFDQSTPDRSQVSDIIQQCKTFTDEEIHRHIDEAYQSLKMTEPTLTSLLTQQQVSEMSNSGLVEFGSHTCNHTRLNNAISKELCQAEVIKSREQITEMLQLPVTSFCFPNGDYNDYALRLVKQNYQCAVTTERGWNSVATDGHQLKRIGVHNDVGKHTIRFQALISDWPAS